MSSALLPYRFFAMLTLLVCSAGCSTASYKSFDGPVLPPSETVVIRRYSQNFWSLIDVVGVDGQRTHKWGWTNEIAVLPGSHLYKVLVLRRQKWSTLLQFLGGRDIFNYEAVCGFSLDSPAGKIFELMDVDNGDVVAANEQNVYRATLKIEEQVLNGDPVRFDMPIECVSMDALGKGGADKILDNFCRSDSDCLTEVSTCYRDTGFLFGICKRQ